ncbi:MAG: UbiD family decarboxylase domain-containing protein, partial [Planctomycetota bacterium]
PLIPKLHEAGFAVLALDMRGHGESVQPATMRLRERVAQRDPALFNDMHHDGAANFRKYAARGEPMPLALVFGGESVLPYAATCPLPPDVSELLFAGFLHGKCPPSGVRAR